MKGERGVSGAGLMMKQMPMFHQWLKSREKPVPCRALPHRHLLWVDRVPSRLERGFEKNGWSLEAVRTTSSRTVFGVWLLSIWPLGVTESIPLWRFFSQPVTTARLQVPVPQLERTSYRASRRDRRELSRSEASASFRRSFSTTAAGARSVKLRLDSFWEDRDT